MTLVRVRPARPVQNLWDSFDNIFDRRQSTTEQTRTEAPDWSPALDIQEDPNRYVIEVEIPGIDKKDIHLSAKENILTISGEKKQPDNRTEKQYCRERTYGSFQRKIRFGHEVINDKIDAQYQNGVLTVILPKSSKSQIKEIPVNFN